MNFLSPQQLYDHLAEIIDDEDFILRSVRVHFPAYKREMRRAAREGVVTRLIDEAPKRQPADPYGPQAMIQHDAMVKQGSQLLLKALHSEHSEIMRFAASKGRLVVYP